ncbi:MULTISPECIES: hypothetical protein [unclassified Bradyrhizobium]|uniref:hypothetical protein n=1 Tax=unclassified Bradyrhizobium TaxID=2631580 RepID=UPI002916CF97|nr:MULTISPECIES: hypothetical protein [unclassified Bradyrhizobium]
MKQSPHTPFLRGFTDERAKDLAETASLYARVTSAHRASAWARPDAVTLVSNAIVERVCEVVELPAYQPLGRALDDFQQEMLRLETAIFSSPTVDFSRPITLIEQTQLNRHLRSQEYFLSHDDRLAEQLADTIGNISAGLIQSLPPLVESAFTVPLISLLHDPSDVADRIVGTICSNELIEVGLLTAVGERIYENICTYSGVPLDGNSKRPLIKASDAELSPEELVETYFAGTPIRDLLLCPLPFALPDETRFSGHWIIAPPGRGKTTLLHAMFLDDLPRHASIVVMDSKGDLINPIKNMAAVADRLVLIEPDSYHPLALNPLDVPSENIPHTIALIEYILSGLLDAKFTNLQSALFRHVLPAMLQAFPNPTIDTLKRVLADGLTRDEVEKLDSRLRQFFENKASGFHSKTYAETRSQIIWRLDFILTNDTMRAMFASPTTRLKIGEAMNIGKIVLIDASKAKLGDEGSEFYQRFFLALILGAAQARSTLRPSEKLPVYCYLDECQWVRNDQKLATILDECRSQKIALILAHQRTDQITNPNVLSAVANCAIRFANSDDEAKYLAPKLRCEPEFLHNLPRGTFAAFVRDLTPHAIALKVPYRNIEDLPRMTAAQQVAIRQRMRDDYGFIPEPPPIHAAASSFSAREAPANATASPARAGHDKPRSAATRRDDPPPANDKPETGSTW